MSVILNTLALTNKDGPFRPVSKNSSNTRTKNLKEPNPRRDSKDYRMTLEGWSQTINSESFLFTHQDECKLNVVEKVKQKPVVVETNNFKNTLSNLPDAVIETEKKTSTDTEKKTSTEKVQVKKDRSQSENKAKEMLLKLEKAPSVEKTTPQPKPKKKSENLTERSESDKYRHEFRKLNQQRLLMKKAVNVLNMDQIDESVSSRKENEKTERPVTSWKLVVKTPKSSKNIKNLSQIEQNQSPFNIAPIVNVKQTIHTINFQTKLSPSQVQNLERFQAFTRKQGSPYKESQVKSARGGSTSSLERPVDDITNGRESVQKFDANSPTAKIVPPLNFQPLRKSINPVFVFPFSTEAGPENKSITSRPNWKTLQDDAPAKRKLSLKAVFRGQSEGAQFDDYCQTSGPRNSQKMRNTNTFEVSKIQPRPRIKETKPILVIPSPKSKTQRDSILAEISKEAKMYVLTQRSNIKNLFKSIAATSKIPNNGPQDQGFAEMLGFASVSSSRTKRLLNS